MMMGCSEPFSGANVMSRQVCVSEDDLAHSDRDPTHNWELRETLRVMRTTA